MLLDMLFVAVVLRPKGKRRVKPIPSHLLQLTFGMESDTDDDAEYTCAKGA